MKPTNQTNKQFDDNDGCEHGKDDDKVKYDRDDNIVEVDEDEGIDDNAAAHVNDDLDNDSGDSLDNLKTKIFIYSTIGFLQCE